MHAALHAALSLLGLVNASHASLQAKRAPYPTSCTCNRVPYVLNADPWVARLTIDESSHPQDEAGLWGNRLMLHREVLPPVLPPSLRTSLSLTRAPPADTQHHQGKRILVIILLPVATVSPNPSPPPKLPNVLKFAPH